MNVSKSKEEGALSRRAREKEAHRREILAAAERVFAAKGFDGSTMEEVAREAEFSVGALYNFFANKEVLWSQVIARIGQDFLAAFRRKTAAAANPLAAIEALIEVKLSFARDHAAILNVIMEVRPGARVMPDMAMSKSLLDLYDTYLDEATRLVKAAMVAGYLRKADPVHTTLMLEGAINTIKVFWMRRGMDLSLAEQVCLVKQHFLAPLRAP